MHLSQVIHLLILGVVTTNENFQILSCNDVNKLPKLSFKIKQEYFDSNVFLTETRNSYQKIGDWYHKTVDGSDLSVEFMQNEDYRTTALEE